MAKKADKQTKIPPSMQPWIEARKRFRLSHGHVQMARELGLNPQKLGKLANHGQEPWKLPLPDFIVKLYLKHFGRERPETVRSIEEIAAAKQAKKQARKAGKSAMRQSPPSELDLALDRKSHASSLDSFLEEEGTLAEFRAVAIKGGIASAVDS